VKRQAAGGRSRLLRVAAVAGLALTASVAAHAQGYRDPGMMLPLQDRAGNGAAAAVVERILIEEMSLRGTLARPTGLRDVLRRYRIRDLNGAPPARLDLLAEELGVSWFFSAKLFEVQGAPMPVVTLSAQVRRKGNPDLEWAGFVSMTGLDTRRALGRNQIYDLETLARRAVRQLVSRLAMKGDWTGSGQTPPPSEEAFVYRPLSLEEIGRVAVIPFESLTEIKPEESGELVTELAMAVLHGRGVRVAAPGTVDAAQRRQGVLLRGRVSAELRSALDRENGIDMILTGTVEELGLRRGGLEPEPEIAFGARLIGSTRGRIYFIDGGYRSGWDEQKVLGGGRIYAAGALGEQMMQSMVASFLPPEEDR
jgi:hypothetical protein